MSGRKSTKVQRTCEACGKTWLTYPSCSPRFCSRRCQMQATRVALPCRVCGKAFVIEKWRLKIPGHRRLCSFACRQLVKAVPVEIRFRWYVGEQLPNGCIPWIGATYRRGYGKIGRNGHSVCAHRLAWELAHGPIPDGLDVLHECDNPPCVNPEHLFLGTKADNVADMIAKGRQACGEVVATSKLTTRDVLGIRAQYAAGVSQSQIARTHDIGQAHISRIVNRKCWKHVS